MQQAAGRFLEQLLRHVTGEDRAGAACSCLGTQSVPLRFPPSPRTPMGQPAPTARDQMAIPWHLRDDSPWASVGSKEAEAAQDNNQEAACSVPDTPGKEENRGQEGRCWRRR